MKLVFLVGNYVPHQLLTINSLIELYNANILAISVSKNFTFIPKDSENLVAYKLEDLSKTQVLEKIIDFDPAIVVVAGWMIKDYNWISRKLKKKLSVPILGYSDTPWYGTIKQKINKIISPIYIKTLFTHMWVAGTYQYEYARKLGFKNDQIIFNSLSADTPLFSKVDLEKKKNKYPKNFLFIGRFVEIKGIKNLIKAWNEVKDKNDWTLTVVGDGVLKQELINEPSIIVKDYMSQELLLNEFQNSGCFVLPSLKEPWALVIHEAAAAGLPIICTKTCGAAPHFVIDGHNGYKVENKSISSLRKALENIILKSDKDLIEFSKNSRNLSESISPKKLTASLMQLIAN